MWSFMKLWMDVAAETPAPTDAPADAASEAIETLSTGNSFWAGVTEFLGSPIASAALRILSALLILLIGLKLVKWLMKALQRSPFYKKLTPELHSFCNNAIRLVLNLVVILCAIATLGVPMASIIALVGSAGLAVGLALQGSLSNLAGGLMILIFRPFRIGDFLDTGTNSGTVRDIGMFYTTIETVDNRQVMLPNANLSNNAMINTTANDTRRVDLNFPVSPTANAEQVLGILRAVAMQDDAVLQDPETDACISSVEVGAMVATLRVWCKTPEYWPLYNRMQAGCMTALREADVPFPKRLGQ